MNMPKAALLACLLALPVPALAQDGHATHGAAPLGMESSADKALAAVNERMMTSMQMRPSGDVDKDFAQMMIPHHQGAIDMAKIELQYGTDPDMRKLAEAVVAAQESEIAQLTAWLARRR